ncbi:hypothetical protein SXANM310S_00220 [Streptomyces xanthochromogenes]
MGVGVSVGVGLWLGGVGVGVGLPGLLVGGVEAGALDPPGPGWPVVPGSGEDGVAIGVPSPLMRTAAPDGATSTRTDQAWCGSSARSTRMYTVTLSPGARRPALWLKVSQRARLRSDQSTGASPVEVSVSTVVSPAELAATASRAAPAGAVVGLMTSTDTSGARLPAVKRLSGSLRALPAFS